MKCLSGLFSTSTLGIDSLPTGTPPSIRKIYTFFFGNRLQERQPSPLGKQKQSTQGLSPNGMILLTNEHDWSFDIIWGILF